jgi:hypothetical protein
VVGLPPPAALVDGSVAVPVNVMVAPLWAAERSAAKRVIVGVTLATLTVASDVAVLVPSLTESVTLEGPLSLQVR